ncbi:hypothetical protein BJV77DRAFT_1034934 [Russula vinacea]|nr:hypothetical protein BJV77DRAFT_1034934 [Russula vinacea]
MPLFVLVGLFFLQSGRRSHDGHHVHYDTTVACLEGLPIPADVIVECSPSQPLLRDNTAAFVIGRTFVPSRGERGPILLDTLQVSPIPGDPDDASYDTHVPSFSIPVVIAQGSVASASSTDSCATLSFPLAVSDYVWSSVKRSTVLCRVNECDRQSRPNDAVTAVGPCSHLTDSDLLSFHVKALICSPASPPPRQPSGRRLPPSIPSTLSMARPTRPTQTVVALSAASVLLFVPSFYLAML